MLIINRKKRIYKITLSIFLISSILFLIATEVYPFQHTQNSVLRVPLIKNHDRFPYLLKFLHPKTKLKIKSSSNTSRLPAIAATIFIPFFAILSLITIKSAKPETGQPPPAQIQEVAVLSAVDLNGDGVVSVLDDIQALIEDLGDTYKCNFAMDKLVEIGSSAIKPLIEAFSDEDFNIRRGAAEVLIRIGSSAVESLISVLYDDNSSCRQLAAYALGGIGDIRAVRPVINILNDKSSLVRGTAAEALGKMGNLEAVRPLIQLLNDKERFVRSSAAESLGNIGSLEAVRPLIRTLEDDEEWFVHSSAAEALGKIGSVDAVEALIESLKDENIYVCNKAIIALGKIGDGRAVKPLIAIVNSEEGIYRLEASNALIEIGEPAVRPLIASWSDPKCADVKIIRDILTKIGKPAVKDLIDTFESSNDIFVIIEAAITLGDIGNVWAIGPLRNALFENDVAVQSAAESSLLRIVNNLSEDLRLALFNEHPEISFIFKEWEFKCKDIQNKFRIVIENTDACFSRNQLDAIKLVLSNLPEGLVTNRALTIEKGETARGYAGIYTYISKKIVFPKELTHPDHFPGFLFHEIGHFIEEELFPDEVKKIYEKENTNSPGYRQDFAFDVQDYGTNTKQEFLIAIHRALYGDNLYLKKLLFLLRVFMFNLSDDQLVSRVYYTKSSTNIFTKDIPVTSDREGNISSISGISIYNLGGLWDFFNGLKFDGSSLRETNGQAVDNSLIYKDETAELLQNFPNPSFNKETWIPYRLSEGTDVTISIYTEAGNLVRTLELGYKPAGSYITKELSAYWDGKNERGEDVASGVYFYTIKAGRFTATRKMTVISGRPTGHIEGTGDMPINQHFILPNGRIISIAI